MNYDCVIYIIVIIIIMFYINYNKLENFLTKSKICNNIDNRCYPVLDKFENKNDASIMLAHLNNFSLKLIKHMRKKYLWEREGSVQHGNMTAMLLENYNQDNIVENNPTNKNYTSYVEDKGKVFAICLREKKSGKNILHDKNILEFVVMHELAHLASESIGHDEIEFWTNFKILLQNAKEIGIHNPIDYSKNKIEYCSIKVDYNPYYDNTIPPFN